MMTMRFGEDKYSSRRRNSAVGGEEAPQNMGLKFLRILPNKNSVMGSRT
jgi:hypothetical protein